jgi:uncharacterized protein DUF929
LDTSAFEPIEPATMEELLNRAKVRSAQLRRRRALLLIGSVGPLGIRAGRSPRLRTPGRPRRFSPTVVAIASVGVVVAVVLALVLVDVTSGSSGRRIPVAGQTTTPTSVGNSLAPTIRPAPASLVDAVTAVTTLEANAVGVPSTSTVAPPTVQTGQPPLEIDGKPAAIFIGGEFCPYCAAERWAIVMAFSRFGTFTGLTETTSSPWDTDPSTPTFSFDRASYTSTLLTLATSEHESNDTDGLGTRTRLQPLTDLESTVWQRYDNPEGFPFLDIGNSVFVLTPSYDPRLLSGLDQADVAAKLSNPDDPVTVAIVGTANYLTAAICSMIGSNSSPWCHQPAVTKAARAMGLVLGS